MHLFQGPQGITPHGEVGAKVTLHLQNLRQAELCARKPINYLINQVWHVLHLNIDGWLGVFCSHENQSDFLKCQRKRQLQRIETNKYSFLSATINSLHCHYHSSWQAPLSSFPKFQVEFLKIMSSQPTPQNSLTVQEQYITNGSKWFSSIYHQY